MMGMPAPPSLAAALLALSTGQIVVIVSCIGALAVVAVILGVRHERKRWADTGRAFSEAGLEFMPQAGKLPRGERAGVYAPFAGAGLRTADAGMRWLASGALDGREVRAMEHRFVVSTGKSSHAVHHVAAATPCPVSWPTMSLQREHLLHRIADFLGARDITVEDEKFNARWRVRCSDEDFAVLFLSPAVQEWLTNAPAAESWTIGGGWVVAVRRERTRPARLLELCRRPGALLGMVPPELGAWGHRADGDV